MLDDSTIAELARRLQRAEDEKQFIRMFSLEHPDMTVEDAYAIQRAWTAIKLSKGRVVKGHKIGHVARDAERGRD
jgi:2-oxo-hept-3-ene-1,7-dioate hydratase